VKQSPATANSNCVALDGGLDDEVFSVATKSKSSSLKPKGAAWSGPHPVVGNINGGAGGKVCVW
jgi:hypothetical protein